MEAALQKIDADLLIASEESGQVIYSSRTDSDSSKDLTHDGQRFASLNRLSTNLKMGFLNEIVTVKEGEVRFCKRHPETQLVGIASAKSLDRAFLAESLVNQVLDDVPRTDSAD